MLRWIPVLLLVLLGASLPSSTPVTNAASSCQFVLGFKTIHDAMPDIVGDCVVDEHHNPANGDGLQETSGKDGKGGLLVWRKADNWTAFTDGYRTWVNGPNGLQQRLNTERFPFEGDDRQPQAQQAPAATPAPSANVVHSGAYCSPEGATGVTSTGLPMVCAYQSGESRARWRTP